MSDKIRLIANIIKDDKKFKSILFKLSAKFDDGRRIELVDVWMPRNQIDMRDKTELWATRWIIERKEEELSRESFDGQVVELATFGEVG